MDDQVNFGGGGGRIIAFSIPFSQRYHTMTDRKRKFQHDSDGSHYKISRRHDTTGVATQAHLVAKHYNDRPDVGREKRKESRIIRLRSFNNWIKSTLIRNHIRSHYTVFDMGCGKGGDLGKFAKANIDHLVAAGKALKHLYIYMI